jgi:hypothetical protein
MDVTYRPAGFEDLEPGLRVEQHLTSCAAGMGCARWRSVSLRFSASSMSRTRPASGSPRLRASVSGTSRSSSYVLRGAQRSIARSATCRRTSGASMLSGSAMTGDTLPPRDDLLAVAEELSGSPSEDFRAQLGAKVVAAARPNRADGFTTSIVTHSGRLAPIQRAASPAGGSRVRRGPSPAQRLVALRHAGGRHGGGPSDQVLWTADDGHDRTDGVLPDELDPGPP